MSEDPILFPKENNYNVFLVPVRKFEYNCDMFKDFFQIKGFEICIRQNQVEKTETQTVFSFYQK